MSTASKPETARRGRLSSWVQHRALATQVLAIHMATLMLVLLVLGAVSFSYMQSNARNVAVDVSLSRLRGLARDIDSLPANAGARGEVRRKLNNYLESPTYLNAALVSASGEVLVTRNDDDASMPGPGLLADQAGSQMLDSQHIRTWVPLPSGRGHVVATVNLMPAGKAMGYLIGTLVVIFVAISASGGLVFGSLIRRHASGLERLVAWARDRAKHLDLPPARPPREATGSRELRALEHALTDLVAQRTHQLQAKEHALFMLGKVIDAAPEAVVVYDVTGVVRICNGAMERHFGWRADQLVGGTLDRLIPAADKVGFMQTMLDFAMRGDDNPDQLVLDRTILRANGEPASVRLHAEIIRLPQGPKMCVFLRDMTQEFRDAQSLQLALAAARQSAEAKSRFLANMSHEIRTPLNGITGMLDLMTRSAPTEEQREYINVMRSSARLLRNLLNDILDLSKIEAGRLELESLPFNLEQQLRDTCAPFKAIAEARGLSFDVRFDVGHPMLLGDPFRITQILNNLLDNAIKFTAEGGVRVEVESHADAADRPAKVCIVVADTGAGIPEELQGRLFGAFNQADESVTRRYGGTGLGLALCRQLSRMMGGDIQLASAVGKGSQFVVTVFLPEAELTPDFLHTQPDGLLDELARSLSGRRLLVVDDNRTNQILLQKWLKREGAQVDVANNGEEAVSMVGQTRFDAILMDVSMPVMNGYDASRAIRTMGQLARDDQTWGSSVPIIGVTALAMGGERTQCRAAGMNDYLTKPIDRATLIRTLAPLIAANEDQTRSQPLIHMPPEAVSA